MTTGLIILLCIVAEGFFSGSEIALVNANRLKLSHQAENGNFGARMALKFLQAPEMLLGATLVGTNLCTVTGTVTTTLFMIERFGSTGELFAILLYGPLTFLFGEFIPKTIYQANAGRIAPRAAPILRVFQFFLYPVIWLFTRFSTMLIRMLRERGRHEPLIMRRDVRALARSSGHGSDIELEEKRIIRRMIDFSTARVSEVMVPLIDVIAVAHTMTVGEAARFSKDHSYSRFPVFRDRVDQIVGVVDTYALLNSNTLADPIRKTMKKPVFVPETMSLKRLMSVLRHRSVEIAVVVDEYGGAVGTITLEDVLEEIVGEIEDESDTPASLYRKIGASSYIFQARTEVTFINERFSFQLPRGEYETLGGYLLERFDRIPRHGETRDEGKLRFTVLNPTDRTLTEVRIDVLPDAFKTPA